MNAPVLDFQKWRKVHQSEIKHLLPKPGNSLKPTKAGSRLRKYPFLFNLISLAAYYRYSSQPLTGHLSISKLKLYYIRIPKSGNTSISSEMLRQFIPEIKSENFTSTQINLLTDAWLQHDLSVLQEFTGFTVVRNPLHRLVSVYHDIFEQDRSEIFIYQNYLGGILTKDLSFKEFVKRIVNIPDRLKDQHFKPQHLFLDAYFEQNLKPTVFKLEQPEILIDFLKPYGLNLVHLNKTSDYHYPDYYDSETLELAIKMYTLDFKMFDYEQLPI